MDKSSRKLSTDLAGQLLPVLDLLRSRRARLPQSDRRVGDRFSFGRQLPADKSVGQIADIGGVKLPEQVDHILDDRDLVPGKPGEVRLTEGQELLLHLTEVVALGPCAEMLPLHGFD